MDEVLISRVPNEELPYRKYLRREEPFPPGNASTPKVERSAPTALHATGRGLVVADAFYVTTPGQHLLAERRRSKRARANKKGRKSLRV